MLLPFTITTHLTKEEYTKLIFKRSFKSPLVIFVFASGMLCLLVSIAAFLKVIPISFGNGYTTLIFGLIALWIPMKIKISATKIYNNNPRIKDAVSYTFTNENITVKGTGFESSFAWNNIQKIEEVDNYMFLYTSKVVAEIIKRDRLILEQIAYIRSKFASSR